MEAQLIEKGILTQSLATVAAMDIYVATTGDDETGDGLVGSPYLTITRAYQDVPYTLRHLVHIHVAAGAYTDWPQGINNRYELGGSLSIDGTAAMADFDAGPYTIDAGAPVALGASKVYDIPAVGGGLTPAAWDGKFMEMLDGANVGNIYAIIENDATDVRIQGGWTVGGAGDKFKIVEPGVTVALPAVDCTIKGDASSDMSTWLGLVGLDLTTVDTLTAYAGNLCLQGSILNVATLRFRDGAVRGYYSGPDATFLDVPSYATNWAGCAVVKDSVGGKYVFCFGHTSLGAIVFLRSLDVTDATSFQMSLVSIKNLIGYGMDIYNSVGVCKITTSYIEAKSTHNAIQISDCAYFSIDMYVQAGVAAIHAKSMCIGRVKELVGVDANVANALLLENGSRISIAAAGCTLVGATGAGTAIKWASGAADSAYPAANLEVNDALGAQVVGT